MNMIKKIIKGFLNPIKIPQYIYSKVITKKYQKQNYNIFLKSKEKAIDGDLPYNINNVYEDFKKIGLTLKDLIIDKEKFKKYLKVANYPKSYIESYGLDYFPRKALEHYISLQFNDKITNKTKIIDIANASSPFPEIFHKLYNAEVYSNDLCFKKGITKINNWYTKIGCNAGNLPFEDNYFDLITLHCALEMFECDDDIMLIKEANRVLKKDGKLIIVPLYMNEIHHILRDPKTSVKILPKIDEGAKLVYRNNFYSLAFARFYSVQAFQKRLLENSGNLGIEIFRLKNTNDIISNPFYWVAVFTKK